MPQLMHTAFSFINTVMGNRLSFIGDVVNVVNLEQADESPVTNSTIPKSSFSGFRVAPV